MAYSTPMTATVGMVHTAAQWNTYVRDNMEYLKGNAGSVAIGAGMTVGAAGLATRVEIVGTSATLIMSENDQAVDENRWDVVVNSKSWLFRAVNDAYTASAVALTVVRGTGTAISYISVPPNLVIGAAASISAKLGVNGGVAVGAGYYNQSPPTNGLLVQGSVGIGLTAPDGPLHVAGAVGGMAFVAKSAVANSSVTLLSAGTVTRGCSVRGMLYRNTGAAVINISGFTCPLSSTISLYDDGTSTNVFQMTVTAGGQVTVRRSAGSDTYDCSLILSYL